MAERDNLVARYLQHPQVTTVIDEAQSGVSKPETGLQGGTEPDATVLADTGWGTGHGGGKLAGVSPWAVHRWFPPCGDVMLAEPFVRLSVCEKSVLLDINFRPAEHRSLVKCGWRTGLFGESDAKWAKRLCMSPATFQNARCKIGQPKDKRPKTPGYGWAIYTSGYRTREEELRRTEHHDARHTLPASGIQSGALARRVWHDLIAALQRKHHGHRDLLVVAFVCFFWKILGGREMGSITVPKAKVASMGGIPAATFKASLERLRSIELSTEHCSIGLLEFRDKRRYGFQITEWAGGRMECMLKSSDLLQLLISHHLLQC